MADVATSADRSWPLQGGLPPAAGTVEDALEVACDESGFSGSNLLDPATPVFAHASVDLTVEEAAELMTRTGARFRRSLDELKSARFLRAPDADHTLDWLLTALDGHAHVVLVDKEFFLATRVVDLFLAEPTYAAGTRLSEDQRPVALALYRAGRRTPAEWAEFLAAFADLVRTKRRQQLDRRVFERFFRARDALAAQRVGDDAADVLGGLTRTRVRAVVTRMLRVDPDIPPPLEPLLPALAETVLFWGAQGRRVLVVHDEQSALTAPRLSRLRDVLAVGDEPSPLVGLVTVDSRDDPRVQVADLLAGVARRAPEVGAAEALEAFLSPTSLRDVAS